jgi:diguanylate cyclase (GGDEF)-like protein
MFTHEGVKMTTLIAQELESEALHRFHADFRRALLMHRKESLNLFFRLQFPMAESPLYEGDWSVEHLGIVRWLAEPPSESIREHAIYRELIARQESLIRLAQKAVDGIEKGVPQAGSYANLLHAMHEFDRAADRLSAGITTSLTDVDELTGLLNRAAMERDLARDQEHARLTGRRFTIAMIDADHFKKVNDEHGHGFGDVVLEALAERFIESLRPSDRVYRYGGEEFLVLLPDTPLDQARSVLERIRRRACGREISDGEIAVTQPVSIGAAEATGNEPIPAVIERADAALYRAKQSGRNRVELDDPRIT